jgi:hypothetical protein
MPFPLTKVIDHPARLTEGHWTWISAGPMCELRLGPMIGLTAEISLLSTTSQSARRPEEALSQISRVQLGDLEDTSEEKPCQSGHLIDEYIKDYRRLR